MWVDVIDNKDQSLTIEETISLQIEVCHVDGRRDGELGDSGDVERMWNCGWAITVTRTSNEPLWLKTTKNANVSTGTVNDYCWDIRLFWTIVHLYL